MSAASGPIRAHLLRGIRRLRNVRYGPQARLISGRNAPSTPAAQRNILFVCGGILLGGAGTALALGRGPGSSVDTNSRSVLWDQTTASSPRPKKYADTQTMLKAVAEIQDALGKDAVSVDEADLESHAYSEWSTSNADSAPVAVIRPRSTEQVSAIAKICTKYRVPMVPYGAGSSVEGNFSAPYSGICIDLSAMNQIVAFHPDDMDVVVQPGVNWVTLNEEIKDSGLFLPLDPSPTATIGGMVSTNCSGTNAMRYGTMKDYVLSLTVVLADGSVIRTRHRPRKTSAGYNLNSMFTGSEGTLGIITEATVKLAVLPTNFGAATATFPTVKHAVLAASQMIRNGAPLAALELMDEVQMKVINMNGGTDGKKWAELPTLFIKFSGSENTIKEGMKSMQESSRQFQCQGVQFANTDAEIQSLWAARKGALWAMLAVRPEGTEIWSTDVAVPISKMADIIDQSKERAGKLGLFNTVLGHVGDGNFHQAIMYNPNKEPEKMAVKGCIETMMHQALEFEGTVSGEHGIGLGKKECLAKELGPTTIGVMKAMKETLDPHWLLNPGKVFDI